MDNFYDCENILDDNKIAEAVQEEKNIGLEKVREIIIRICSDKVLMKRIKPIGFDKKVMGEGIDIKKVRLLVHKAESQTR